MPSRPSATPSAMAQTPAPTISTCCCASASSDGRLAPARVAGDELHLLAHQRCVFRRDIFAEQCAHHPQHQLVAGIGDHGLGLAVGKQFQHRSADFVLDFRRQAGLGIGDQADVALRLVGRLQPALVAGHVHQHHQQHTDIAFGDRRRRGRAFCAASRCSCSVSPLCSGVLPAIRHRRPMSSRR